MDPGIYPDLTNDQYHGITDALGSTTLKTLAHKTPAHYKWETENPRSSTAFETGTLAHSLILEGRCDAQVIDVTDKRGKAWTEPAAEARNAGLIPVKASEWADIVAMRDAVMAHTVARRAIEGGQAEQSVFWEHSTETMLKCRPDMLHQGGPLGNMIVDLKTVQSADANEFAKAAANFGYHIQQAHYQAGLKAVTGEDHAFVFVLVEKTGAFLPNVVELSPEDVERGAALAERSIRIWNECTANNRWPGYPTAQAVDLPVWARITEEGVLDENLRL